LQEHNINNRRFCQNKQMQTYLIRKNRRSSHSKFSAAFILFLITACEPKESVDALIMQTGTIRNTALNEASGMQASRLTAGVFFLHNDDGRPQVYAMDMTGASLGSFRINNAKNRDWEDITIVPSAFGPLLLLADIGDNESKYRNVVFNFVKEPVPGSNGKYAGSYPLLHTIHLTYPDGARDAESIAFDPSSDTIYIISKRDKPARLYSISLQRALETEQGELQFRGELARLRPPDSKDFSRFGRREGQWIAQPTGLDISTDGKQAAVISYRSIYIFKREENENWPSAFARKPVEFVGPPSRQEEAIAYAADSSSIMITTEGVPAPVFRFRLTDKPQGTVDN